MNAGRRGVVLLVTTLAAALGGARAEQEGVGYLAVLSDGRLIEVRGASLIDDATIRLDLGGGATIDLPLTRLERVIEATPIPTEDPPIPPPCVADWADEPLPDEVPFATAIAAAAKSANLNPWLVATVIDAESRFNPGAVSRVGARGLMQLMPSVWRPAGLMDPHDVRGNLRVGCRYLREQVDRFGNLATALAAYNAGPGTVQRFGGVPPYRETTRYVAAVLSRYCPGRCEDAPCESSYNAPAPAPGEASGSAEGPSSTGGESPHDTSN